MVKIIAICRDCLAVKQYDADKNSYIKLLPSGIILGNNINYPLGDINYPEFFCDVCDTDEPCYFCKVDGLAGFMEKCNGCEYKFLCGTS